MDLSVIVAVHNEADNIAPLTAEIRAALDGKLAFEIVYVDDGSTDGTAAALVEARQTAPELRVVTHTARCGKSRALIDGIRRAKAATVVTMDGDCQDNPANIETMWAQVTRSGAVDPKVVVCAWRRNRRDSWWRKFISRIANRIRAGLLGDRTPDSGCGFKMFNRDAFLELPRFDNMHRFLPALFLKCGCEIISVDVHHRPRAGGRSKYGTWDRLWVSVWDLLGVMWLQRRTTYSVVEGED
jgi:dolichol-phosphate mannosyltransferase